MTKANTKKEKQLLIKSIKDELGFFDYWAGYPKVSKILRHYGDYPLKQGKLTTGFSLQVNSLKRAINDIKPLKGSKLTVRYRKHNYSVDKVYQQVMSILKPSLKDLSPHHNGKTHEARMSLCEGHDSFKDKNGVWKPQNINDWTLPLVKNRRQKPAYIHIKHDMQKAQNDWLEVTTQDEDKDNIYFSNKNTLQMVSSNEIYNLLTKDFPW